MTATHAQRWVRGGGQALAFALLAYLLWTWAMRRPEHAELQPTRIATIANTNPSHPAEPKQGAADPAEPIEHAPGPPVRRSGALPSASEVRQQAQEVQLGVEQEPGDFADLYEKWRTEPENAVATNAAMQWVEQRLLAIDLVPEAAFLSCRQSLCRLGLGFEQMAELQRLHKIEIPPGLDPKISEVYEYPELHTYALVIYWTAGALPPPASLE